MGEKAKMRAAVDEIATPTFGRLAMTEGGSWLAMTEEDVGISEGKRKIQRWG